LPHIVDYSESLEYWVKFIIESQQDSAFISNEEARYLMQGVADIVVQVGDYLDFLYEDEVVSTETLLMVIDDIIGDVLHGETE
jgi:hypothetical protein